MKSMLRNILHGLFRHPSRQASALGRVVISEENVKSFDDIPGPKGPYLWPVIGTMLLYKPFTSFTAENNHLLFDSLIDKYGPVVKLQLGRLCVLISEVKDMETVFQNEGKYPNNPSMDILKVYEKRNGLKSFLASSSGEEWYRVRNPVNKIVLRPNSATYYLPWHNMVTDDFINLLRTKSDASQDQIDLFYRFAAESIGVVAFNSRLGFLSPGALSQESHDLLETTKELFRALQKTFCGESIAHSFYRNKTYRDFEKSFNTLSAFAQKQLQKAKEETNKDSNPTGDEPNLLYTLTLEKCLTEDDVRNVLQSFYIGGTDSTARSIQLLFYNLANNPEKQETLRQEINKVMGQRSAVTADDLSQMNYLRACIKESYRLIYPTTLGPSRILDTDVVLSGYRVPAGTLIFQANFRTSRCCFGSPGQYLPERWMRSSDGRLAENIPMLATIPFGHGPRHCVGRRFAMQEISLATIKVLQKLKIEVDPECKNMEFIYKSFAEPKRPLYLRFSELGD